MTEVPFVKSTFSKRRIGWAGAAAAVGCIACCAAPILAMPMVAALGLGAGSAIFTSVFRPGNEVFVGAGAFALTLGISALAQRLFRKRAGKCAPACSSDGSCCNGGSFSAESR